MRILMPSCLVVGFMSIVSSNLLAVDEPCGRSLQDINFTLSPDQIRAAKKGLSDDGIGATSFKTGQHFTKDEISSLRQVAIAAEHRSREKGRSPDGLEINSYEESLAFLGLPLTRKILELTTPVSRILNQLDRGARTSLDGYDAFISLHHFRVRTEDGFKIVDEEGHTHSGGWIAGTLALEGPGSWYETPARDRHHTTADELLLFTEGSRSRLLRLSYGPTVHGTPRLEPGQKRTLFIFGFSPHGEFMFKPPLEFSIEIGMGDNR